MAKKNEDSLSSYFAHFARTTSAHGYSRAVAATNSRSVLFWLVLLITANCLFVFLMYNVVHEYLEQYVPVSFEFSEEPFEFPQLTFCVPFSYSLLKFTKAFKAGNLTDYLGDDLMERLQVASQFNNLTFNSELLVVSAKEESKDLWVNFEDVFVLCYYGNVSGPCIDLKQIRCTNKPTCFTISINSTTMQTMSSLGAMHMVLFSESITHPMIPYTIATMTSRIRTTWHNGLRLFVHPARTRPWDFVQEDIILSPGRHYDIALRRRKEERVTSFFGKKRCLKHSRRLVKECPRYKHLLYTAPMCRSVELHNFIREQCNCSVNIGCDEFSDFNFSCYHFNSVDKNYACMRETFKNYFYRPNHCLPACFEETFQKKVRVVPLSDTFIFDIKQYFPMDEAYQLDDRIGAPILNDYRYYIANITKSEKEKSSQLIEKLVKAVRTNFITMTLYFDNGSTAISREKYLISYMTLVSNIGGCLGLWIGCSVISIVEFIDFFCVIFYLLVKKVKKSQLICCSHS